MIGWHVSVNRYKKMIRMILSAMYDTFPDVLPANREAMATYLQHRVIYRIDTLLRSTRDVSSNSLESNSQLQRLTEDYTKIEESRIGANLGAVLYEIDGRSTVSLITGRGRIERVGQSASRSLAFSDQNFSIFIPCYIFSLGTS